MTGDKGTPMLNIDISIDYRLQSILANPAVLTSELILFQLGIMIQIMSNANDIF